MGSHGFPGTEFQFNKTKSYGDGWWWWWHHAANVFNVTERDALRWLNRSKEKRTKIGETKAGGRRRNNQEDPKLTRVRVSFYLLRFWWAMRLSEPWWCYIYKMGPMTEPCAREVWRSWGEGTPFPGTAVVLGDPKKVCNNYTLFPWNFSDKISLYLYTYFL